MRPRLLELYCCEGGAGWGYHLAGLDVTGVDILAQPRYPFRMVQADALEVLTHWDLSPFSVIHASPPCQDHSTTKDLGGGHGTGWMLAATRDRLAAHGIPWVLENVRGAPLAHQDDLFGANGLELCGCMFPELRGQLYEARWFETSFPGPAAAPPPARLAADKMGRTPVPGECMQVTGHFTDAAEGRRRMGADWMTRDGLAQAIPPAYARYIGSRLLEHIREVAA